jgi:hypothetical protein
MFAIALNPLFILISALLYGLSFGINTYFLDYFSHSVGISWIFLPAGLRLLLTLMFASSGAIGIVISSILINIFFYFEDLVLGIGAGILSGLAPLLARYLSFKSMDLRANLSALNGPKLLNCILIFSLISPLLHQALFTTLNPDNLFLENLGAMIFGDLIGTILVVYVAKLIIFKIQKRSTAP